MIPNKNTVHVKLTRNTELLCYVYSELIMKTIEKRHLFGFGVFIANFEQIEQSNLVLILLSYNT